MARSHRESLRNPNPVPSMVVSHFGVLPLFKDSRTGSSRESFVVQVH